MTLAVKYPERFLASRPPVRGSRAPGAVRAALGTDGLTVSLIAATRRAGDAQRGGLRTLVDVGASEVSST